MIGYVLFLEYNVVGIFVLILFVFLGYLSLFLFEEGWNFWVVWMMD